jgi:hypothetical protein
LPDVALRRGHTHGDGPAKPYPGIGGAGLVEESDAAGVGVGAGCAGPDAPGAALLHDHLKARQVSRLAVGNNDGPDLCHSGNWRGRWMCQSQLRRDSYNERNSSKALTDDDDE